MSRGNETWIGEFKTDIRMGFHFVGRTVKKNQAAVGQTKILAQRIYPTIEEIQAELNLLDIHKAQAAETHSLLEIQFLKMMKIYNPLLKAHFIQATQLHFSLPLTARCHHFLLRDKFTFQLAGLADAKFQLLKCPTHAQRCLNNAAIAYKQMKLYRGKDKAQGASVSLCYSQMAKIWNRRNGTQKVRLCKKIPIKYQIFMFKP